MIILSVFTFITHYLLFIKFIIYYSYIITQKDSHTHFLRAALSSETPIPVYYS